MGPLQQIGPSTTADLLFHAYVLTRISVYVLHGWGSIPASVEREWDYQRFTDQVDLAGGTGS